MWLWREFFTLKFKKKMSKYTEDDLREELETKEYEYGFYTDIESDTFANGLNEDVVRAISKKKNEPIWMTDWRIEAFRVWEKMKEPEWANVRYEKPKFQDIAYYSAPKKKPKLNSLDEVDPELLDTFKRLGISLDEQKKLANVAVDIVMDSVSVATTFKKTLGEKGIIFMPISEAIQECYGVSPELSTTGGTSDGRFIANICKQVIEFGPLNATIHKLNECVAVADIEPLKDTYRITLEKLLLA